MAKKGPRLPGPNHRQFVVGKTGSGKTVGALFQLSMRDYTDKPWYIVDFKRDIEINSIEGAEYRNISDPLSDYPGIYIIQPNPGDDDLVEDFLWRVWEHGNIGLYIDEMYMVGDSPAVRALLTQGRSKNIPMIMLAQRPSRISRFAISEAEFFQVYRITDRRDRKTLEEYIPPEQVDLTEPLAKFHSWYYDADDEQLVQLGPIPIDDIQPRFAARLAELKQQLDPPEIPDENEPEKPKRIFRKL